MCQYLRDSAITGMLVKGDNDFAIKEHYKSKHNGVKE